MCFAAAFPQPTAQLFDGLQKSVVDYGSWFYVLTVAIILSSVVYLGISDYGSIKLGPDHATPDYSLTTWLSMLFAAGMGIGLMFFGVAEPLMHYLAPPTAAPQTLAAVREAMQATFFHWGLHAWAIYAIVALILAYFSYRHKLPLTLRSALYPIIGDRIYGWPGHLVDIFAVVGTTFGVATSLGFGTSQVNAGLHYLFGLPVSTGNQVLLMFAITAIAALSVVSGLDKGVRRLSEINMLLAIALLLLIFILGPSVFLLKAYLQNLGGYLSDMVRMTLNLFAYKKTDWIGGWTIFYWGWWLAWAPFVGLFIARISRGRTIRQFVIGVLLLPAGFTLFWMTVFGNSAIDLVFNHGYSRLHEMVQQDTAVALFVFLEQYPVSHILSFIAVLMIIVFFVTSCDSGAMVVDMLCSHGNNDTPVWQRIYWAVGVGLVAAVLLFAGGLHALQTMTIVSALPFSLVLLLSIIGLIKALKIDAYKQASQQLNAIPTHSAVSSESWRERLQNIINFPNKSNANRFLDEVVKSAFALVAAELNQKSIETKIQRLGKGITLTVLHDDERDFVYGVYRRRHTQPGLTTTEINSEEEDDDDEQSYYRAEVHLTEGGQDYDIMGWSKEAVINDIVDQYQKHLHFLHLLS